MIKYCLALIPLSMLLMALAPPSPAAEFPNRPIKVVVPFAAGGQGDVMARLIAQEIEKKNLLPQPITILNVPGGGGSIGIRKVKNANPDGYTLLYLHETLMTNHLQGHIKFGYKDFIPVAETNYSCLVTITAKDGDIQNAQDWISKLKARPNEVKEATLIGSIAQYTTAMFAQQADVKVGMVNVGGGSARIASVLGHHTQTAVAVPSSIVRNGNLRGLVYYGKKRNDLIPSVPTAKELGYDVVSCLDNVWWAPPGTSVEVVKQLQRAFKAALQEPELVKAIKQRGDTPKFLDGKSLDHHLADIHRRLQSVAGHLR